MNGDKQNNHLMLGQTISKSSCNIPPIVNGNNEGEPVRDAAKPTADFTTVDPPIVPMASAKQSVSGFVLISVKHTSRVPRKKPFRNAHLAHNSKKLDSDSVSSSVEDSSPGSSRSSLNGEGSSHHLYGPGSVEAEEFEDDEPDQAASDDHTTLVDGVHTKRFSKSFEENGFSRGQITPCTPVEKSKLSLHLISQVSGTATPLSHPAARWPDASCYPAAPPDRSLYSTVSRPLALNGHTNFQRAPAHSDMFSPPSRPLPTELLPIGVPLQANTSHFDSEPISCLPTNKSSMHITSVSNHISEVQYQDSPSMSDSSASRHCLVNGDHPGSATQPLQEATQNTAHPSVLMYPHYDHAQHAPYGPSRVTCDLHYLHSGSHSESNPSRLVLQTDADQLPPIEATISVASLPPLQPASRFRKARIYETVEQWSHGRTLVHDCRLRTVPEWVHELQKKTGAMERHMTAALEQKFNCFSCFEMKSLDRTRSGTETLRIPEKFNSLSTGPISLQQAAASGVNSGSSKIDQLRDNLFSFWDNGFRVHCALSNTTRPSVAASTIPLQSQQDAALCLLCVHSLLPQNVISPPNDSQDHQRPQIPPAQSSESCTNLNGFVNLPPDMPVSSAIPPSGPLRSPVSHNDPATAYLRRHQAETAHHQPLQISTCPEPLVRHGNSPLVTEPLSTLHTESTRLTPDSIDYAGRFQSPYNSSMENAPQLVLPQVHPATGSDVQLSTGKLSKPVVSGLVPPTSPTFVDTTEPPLGNEHADLCLNGSSFTDSVCQPEELQPGPSTSPDRTALVISSGCQSVTHMDDLPVENKLHTVLKPLSSPTSFRADSPLPNRPTQLLTRGELHPNEPIVNTYSSSAVLTPGKVFRPNDSTKSTAPRGSQYPMTPALSSSDVPFDLQGDVHSNFLSTSGLEARISRSMDVIRSAMESAFQRELSVVHSENVRLLAEIDRLNREVTLLRGYQSAFFALRPFVSKDIWEHLQSQQQQQRLDGNQFIYENFPVSPLSQIPDSMQQQ